MLSLDKPHFACSGNTCFSENDSSCTSDDGIEMRDLTYSLKSVRSLDK